MLAYYDALPCPARKRSLRKAIGIKKNIPVPRFEAFLGKITSNQLVLIGKSGSPLDVEMPHGGTAIWIAKKPAKNLIFDCSRRAASVSVRFLCEVR